MTTRRSNNDWAALVRAEHAGTELPGTCVAAMAALTGWKPATDAAGAAAKLEAARRQLVADRASFEAYKSAELAKIEAERKRHSDNAHAEYELLRPFKISVVGLPLADSQKGPRSGRMYAGRGLNKWQSRYAARQIW